MSTLVPVSAQHLQKEWDTPEIGGQTTALLLAQMYWYLYSRVPLLCDWVVLKCSCALSESLGLRSKVMKKIEELKMAPVSNGIPDEYLCPITREIMKEPVIAAGECLRVCVPAWLGILFWVETFSSCFPPADGYSYEREAIESWINTKSRTSPMTNLPLQTTLLTPNRTLKMAIFRWTTCQWFQIIMSPEQKSL